MDPIRQTLAEQLKLTDVDIRDRKDSLGITAEIEKELESFRALSFEIVDDVIKEFYDHQTQVPKIRNIIGDLDTLIRLKSAMRGYILRLFNGEYGTEYVNSRLRIGKVHARIGVPPSLFVSSLYQLESIIGRKLVEANQLTHPPAALTKIFLFDLQFVFDTYFQGVVSEVESARDELIAYSQTLEQQVAERTAQIEKLAQTDELTGLWNRRNFFIQLDRELASVERRQSSLTLAFFDLNDFKMINDQEGHLEGDRVLKDVASAIQGAVRSSDIAFRYGGDEFCVLLPDTDEDQAVRLGERIQKAIAENTTGNVSISIGYSYSRPGQYVNADTLIEKADVMMYESKKRKDSPEDAESIAAQ